MRTIGDAEIAAFDCLPHRLEQKSLAQSDELGRVGGFGRASIQLTLAGPGSGKTSTLTGRFVHLIRQGVDPARILAVTLRRRIVRLLELPSPTILHVMTFYTFAFRQLSRNKGFQGLLDRGAVGADRRSRHRPMSTATPLRRIVARFPPGRVAGARWR
jgi:superfamily I DNA/RNA helicase